MCKIIYFLSCLTLSSLLFSAQPVYFDTGSATHLLLSSTDDLYVGTENGLVRLRRGKLERFTQGGSRRRLETITALAEAPDQSIWVGNAKHYPGYGDKGLGIERLNPRGDMWAENLFQKSLQGSLITKILFEANQALFDDVLIASKGSAEDGFISAHSSGGLTVSSIDLSHSKVLLAQEDIFALLADRKGNYWVGTGTEYKMGSSRGLLVYRNGQLVAHFDGTQWNGVGRTRFSDNRNIRALAQDSDGTIWIGLASSFLQAGGLVRFEPYPQFDGLTGVWHGEPFHLTHSSDIRALAVDKLDQLWIGTASGITRYTPQSSIEIWHGNVQDLAYDPKNDTLWAATTQGLVQLENVSQ